MPTRKLDPVPTQTSLFDVPPADPSTPDRRRIRYFAYGSNIDQVQMRYRCPSARLLGTATLRDYCLAFAGHSASRGGAVATVFPCDGFAVPGALYSLTRDDLAVLDRFEGVPWMYVRTVQWVRIAERRKRRAMVYALRDEHMQAGVRTPAPAYLGQIVKAYQRLGLRKDSLSLALAIAARVNKPRSPQRR